MRALPPAAAAILLTAAFAGCFGSDLLATEGLDEASRILFDAEWAELALPFGDDHDHRDPAHHHGLSTPNFEILGWDPLVSDHYGRTAGGHLCGDARDVGDRRLAAVHGITSDVAFVLVDVTDAAEPKPLGEFVLTRAASRDVAITADGRHVVIGSTGPKEPDPRRGQQEGPEALWRSACHPDPVAVPDRARLGPEQDLPLPPGVFLVNIEDPADIFIESIFPVASPLGVHSIWAGEAGGQRIVLASMVNLLAAATHFMFLEIVDTALGSRLVPLSVYFDHPVEGGAPILNGHNDGVVQTHPVTGQRLAFLANWHQGMVILDMTDPRAPQFMSRWTDTEGPTADLAQDGRGNWHQAIPINTTWDGRHYTIIGQEIVTHPSRTASGWVHVLDTTDPAAPQRVASWTLPVDVDWGASLIFSTHYVAIHERTLFVAHYHAGVWAVDLSDLSGQDLLPAIGVFVPDRVSPKPPPARPYDWTPTVMDVNALSNGDLVVWDAQSGIYLVRFDADNPAPPRVFEGLGT